MPRRQNVAPRGAPAGNPQPEPRRVQSASEPRVHGFAKQAKMKTIRAEMDEKRQEELASERNRYLNNAPTGTSLFHVCPPSLSLSPLSVRAQARPPLLTFC